MATFLHTKRAIFLAPNILSSSAIGLYGNEVLRNTYWYGYWYTVPHYDDRGRSLIREGKKKKKKMFAVVLSVCRVGCCVGAGAGVVEDGGTGVCKKPAGGTVDGRNAGSRRTETRAQGRGEYQ